MYEWDEKKAAANLAKHGVPFEAIEDFDWRDAVQVEDGRFDYGEDRELAIGWLRSELRTVTFTWRRYYSHHQLAQIGQARPENLCRGKRKSLITFPKRIGTRWIRRLSPRK